MAETATAPQAAPPRAPEVQLDADGVDARQAADPPRRGSGTPNATSRGRHADDDADPDHRGDDPGAYRLPAAGFLAPLSFVLANVVVYFAGWSVYSTLMVVVLIGAVLIGLS